VPQIFLSYASQDGDFAELVEIRLRERGIETWRDVASLRAGDEWTQEIDTAIQQSDALILILTPAGFASPYVTYEWAHAMGRDVRVIPILREESETHPQLSNVQNLDFTNRHARPWDHLAAAILDAEVQESEPDDASEYETAREQVTEYLVQRSFSMVSFERIRQNISADYDDDFLNELIRRYESDLRHATLKGGKQGLAKRR
jgi:hypothetical protein